MRLADWLTSTGLSASLAAAGPLVNLSYTTYEGTSLANGINQFLGMRYAAPPVGERRFKLPEPPLNQTGVVAATQHGPICYGVEGLESPPLPILASEDCLYVDVFAPANATTTSDLPVMLWIQGGAFVQLFNPNYNGTGLIEASSDEAIVVTFNYRIGPYGFLAGSELAAEGNLNVGLHDQRAAIAWVGKHISRFGGNPNNITLFGTSIGGGSVLLQTLAYGGKPPRSATANWARGIAAAIYVPPVYPVSDLQYQYDQFLDAANCTDLACLRSRTSEEIQAINVGRPPFPGQTGLPIFTYTPVIDGTFLTDHPSAMLAAGDFSRDRPLMLGSSHTEGTIFVPQANTTTDVDAFLSTQFPGLTPADLAEVNKLYADVPSTFPGVEVGESPLYYRLATAFGDAVFNCPTLNFAAGLSAADVPVHLFRDHIVDPAELAAGFIVPHTWEIQAVWGPQYATQAVALPNATSYGPGGANAASVGVVQAYWTSFARAKGDPNALREAGSPAWDSFVVSGGGKQTYGDDGQHFRPRTVAGRSNAWFGRGGGAAGSGPQRLRLQTNGTAMEAIGRDEWARCAFWARVSNRTHA